MKQTSIRAGQILADELKSATGKVVLSGQEVQPPSSGGVPYPEPYLFPWEIYTLSDDDEGGVYCNTKWRIPKDTVTLKWVYRYVNMVTGEWGRIRNSPDYPASDLNRQQGHMECQFGPLKNKRLDIIRAVAILGKKKNADRAKNPPDPAQEADATTLVPYAIARTATPQGPAPPWPPEPPPYQFGYAAQQTPGLATIIPGPYFVGYLEVVSVGSPEKEDDGIHFDVTVRGTDAAGLVVQRRYLRAVKFAYRKVGTKAGGPTVYGKVKHTPEILVTDDQRATFLSTNALVLDFGPVPPKKPFHITRVVGYFSLEEDGSAKREPLKWPSVDANKSESPADVTPFNSYRLVPATGQPMPGEPEPVTYPDGRAALAGIYPSGNITDPPSRPVANTAPSDKRVIDKGTPDWESEPDNDAEITLRIYTTELTARWFEGATSSLRKTWDDCNVTHVFPVVCDYANLNYDGTPRTENGMSSENRWHRLAPMKIPDPATYADAIYYVDYKFHRKIGKRLYWLKNVSSNEADSQNTSNQPPPTGPSAKVDFYVAQKNAAITQITNFRCLDDWAQDGQGHAAVTLAWDNDAAASGFPAVPKEIVCYCTKPGYDDGTILAPHPPGTGGDPADWSSPKFLHRDDDDAVGANDGPWMIEKVVNLARHKEFAVAGSFTKKVKLKTKPNKLKHFYFRFTVIGDNTTNNYVQSGPFDNTPLNDLTDADRPSAPGKPKVKYRQGQLRLKTTAPTTNSKTVYDYEWLVSDYLPPKDATVGFRFLTDGDEPVVTFDAGVIEDGTAVDNSPTAGVPISIRPGAPKMSIPVRKSELLRVPPLGFDPQNLYAQVRAFNRFGATEAAGRSDWSAVSDAYAIGVFEADDIDTSKPGATGTPTVRFRKKHLRAKTTKPTTGERTIYQYEWQFCTVGTFDSGNFITDDDTAPISATVSTVISPGPKVSIPVSKAELTAGGGSYFYRVRAYNRYGNEDGLGTAGDGFGTIGPYTNGAAAFTVSGFDGDNDKPAGVAAAPGAPQIATIGSGGLTVKYPKVDERDFTRYDFAFYITNPFGFTAGNYSLNPQTGQVVGSSLGGGTPTLPLPSGGTGASGLTNENTVWFQGSGKRWHSRIRRRDLPVSTIAATALVGDTVCFVAARCVDRDSDGVERFGVWSGFSAVAFQPGGLDKDAALPSKHYGAQFKNYCSGGGLGHDRVTLAEVAEGATASVTWVGKDWRTFPSGSAASSGQAIKTTANSGMLWVPANHLVQATPFSMGTGGAGICGRLEKGGMQKGETYAISFDARRANASPSSTLWAIDLCDDDAVSLGTVASTVLDLFNGEYHRYNVVFKITQTVSITKRQWVRIRPVVAGSSGDTNTYDFSKIMVNRTARAVPWDSHTDEDGKQPTAALTDQGGDQGSVPTGAASWNDGFNTGGGRLDML